MYDPLIGRWLQVDPMREFASPYVMMGNYPHATDPTGGICDGCPKTERYASAINSDQNYIYDAASGEYALEGFEHFFSEGGESGMLISPNITWDRMSALEKGRHSMNTVEALILHRTAGSRYPQLWLRGLDKAKGAHFYVAKDGTTYQTASLNISVAHLYVSSKQMYSDYYGVLSNSNTIGIEVVGNYSDGKWEPLTAEQISATSMLVQQLQSHYNIHSNKVYPHETVQRKTAGEGQTVLDAITIRR